MDRKETNDTLHAAPILWRYWLLQTFLIPIGVMIVGYLRESNYDFSAYPPGQYLRDPGTWVTYALYTAGYGLVSAWVLWYCFRRPPKKKGGNPV